MSTHYQAAVTLYVGVPFDNDYNHTLKPDTVANKKTWFDANYTHTDISDLMMIKLDTSTSKGTIRLNVVENRAYTYNYAYIDDAKGNKYFAFILGCRYINDGPTESGSGTKYSLYEFDIEVDVMTSFLVNRSTQLKACPLERHHASDDNYNNKRLSEGVPLGDYHVNNTIRYIDFTTEDCYGGMLFTPNIDSNSYVFDPAVQDKMKLYNQFRTPSGARLFFFDLSRLSELMAFLNDSSNPLIKNPNQVITLFTVPKCLFKSNPGIYDETYSEADFNLDIDWQIYAANMAPKDQGTVGGTSVHNKKLLYYPYSFGRLYNDVGNYVTVKYEDWAGVNGYKVTIQGSPIPNVNLKASPKDYNGYSGVDQLGNRSYIRLNPEATVEITNYPMGSVASNSYAAYIAENGQNIMDNLTVAAAGAIAAPVTGGASLMASGATLASKLFQTYEGLQSASNKADSTVGSTSNGNNTYLHLHKQFLFRDVSIRYDMVRQLDRYFSRYGYSQAGEVDLPNPEVRPYFTYIKTLGECFVPTSAARCSMSQQKKVNDVFMNGCTFWNTTNVTSSNIMNFNNIFNNRLNGDDNDP